jgi:biofilm protein TabA
MGLDFDVADSPCESESAGNSQSELPTYFVTPSGMAALEDPGMIVDDLARAARYQGLHALFAQAFEFLRRPDLGALDDGKHAILGDRLLVIVARGQGRGREQSPLEFHRQYIDIQYVVEGTDCIGWLPTPSCQRVKNPYDADKDVGFFYDRPATWLTVSTGQFAVFFPDDAHAPLAGQGAVHKAVVKVAV